MEIGFEVQGVAMSLAGLGESATAVQLIAGIAADWSRVGANATVRFWRVLHDQHIGAARAKLGPHADTDLGRRPRTPVRRRDSARDDAHSAPQRGNLRTYPFPFSVRRNSAGVSTRSPWRRAAMKWRRLSVTTTDAPAVRATSAMCAS